MFRLALHKNTRRCKDTVDKYRNEVTIIISVISLKVFKQSEN